MIFFDSQLAYENEIMNQKIEKEMHNIKGQALRKVAFIAAHFKTEVSNILAYGWFDSLPEAETIAKHLDLNKMELLAIQEEFEAFKDEFLKEKELAFDLQI